MVPEIAILDNYKDFCSIKDDLIIYVDLSHRSLDLYTKSNFINYAKAGLEDLLDSKIIKNIDENSINHYAFDLYQTVHEQVRYAVINDLPMPSIDALVMDMNEDVGQCTEFDQLQDDYPYLERRNDN